MFTFLCQVWAALGNRPRRRGSDRSWEIVALSRSDGTGLDLPCAASTAPDLYTMERAAWPNRPVHKIPLSTCKLVRTLSPLLRNVSTTDLFALENFACVTIIINSNRFKLENETGIRYLTYSRLENHCIKSLLCCWKNEMEVDWLCSKLCFSWSDSRRYSMWWWWELGDVSYGFHAFATDSTTCSRVRVSRKFKSPHRNTKS